MAKTTINTEAENSMKLNLRSIFGSKGIRTMTNDHKKPAMATATGKPQPKGMKWGPINDINSVLKAARIESRMMSVSFTTVYIIFPFNTRIESTNNLIATTSIIAKTIYSAI